MSPPQLFNPRNTQHRWRNDRPTVTLRSRGREHTYKINPLVTSCAIIVGMLAVLGGIGSSTYLVVREDLAKAALVRQANMQHLYEDRIANLRAQVDLATSRQLLDQKFVESRVAKLMLRQNKIGAMQEKVSRLVKNGAPLTQGGTESFKLPAAKATKTPSGLRLGSLVGTSTPFQSNESIQIATSNAEILDSVEQSLARTEQAQLAEIRNLKKRADQKLKKLASILSKQGVSLPTKKAVGGPLIELKAGSGLNDSINALDASLDHLNKLRGAARKLPHGSPTPGSKISSRYGARRDPFTKRRAMHSGLDYRARRGTPVLATAGGKVIKAGRQGGYGKLVEVAHGNGLTTRYAHLSKIRVKVGQTIAKGKRVGDVGSTGRSTGPHLHYEVRRDGRSLNPIHFVRLEKSLKPYL